MDEFFCKYRQKLFEKCLPADRPTGCLIWQGCCKKSGPTPYGMVKAKFPDGIWRALHAHKLMFLIHKQIVSVDEGLEVSHLCHQPKCLNIEHLSLEPHDINNERQMCVNRGKCVGHMGFNDCRLVSGTVRQYSLSVCVYMCASLFVGLAHTSAISM